jgi:hypothetical protein
MNRLKERKPANQRCFVPGESGFDDIRKFCEFIEIKLYIRRSLRF